MPTMIVITGGAGRKHRYFTLARFGDTGKIERHCETVAPCGIDSRK